MAKALSSLIRMHEWDVDEKRRQLAEVLKVLDNLHQQLVMLQEELVREQAEANAHPLSSGIGYAAFAERSIMIREKIEQAIVETDKKVEEARDALSESYQALKKYETAQSNRDAKAAREQQRKEQEVLDEIGLQVFNRNKKR